MITSPIAAARSGAIARAGGQAGWANPLVFARAVRQVWDGPMILAGGLTDGVSMLAALVAGYDLVYTVPTVAELIARVEGQFHNARPTFAQW